MVNKDLNNKYQLVVPTLATVFSIKCPTGAEEKNLFVRLSAKLNNKVTPVNLISYRKILVSAFLPDIQKWVATNDKHDTDFVFAAIYAEIIKMFPLFSAEEVCRHINVKTYMAHKAELEKKAAPINGTSSIPNIEDLYGDTDDSDDNDGEENDFSINVDNKNKFVTLKKFLTKKVIGQEEAINSILDTYKLHLTNITKHSSLFFIGRTGCGKTLLASLLGKRYSGNFFKIDCGSLSDKHEKATLHGAPPGYIGSGEDSLLKELANKSNNWVILFDEIEKAHDKIYDYILSLLDTGTLMDSKGTILDFSKSIFIFSSNQGISDLKSDTGIGFDRKQVSFEKQKEEVKVSLEKHFKPEFLNRIDEVIYFNELTKDDLKKITKIELKLLPIQITDELLDYVVENGYSAVYGARSIKRFIKKRISSLVADALLNLQVPDNQEKYYSIEIVNGEPMVVNLTERKLFTLVAAQ